ncbi:hypothetical protein [Bifidobacterium moraviense]|uniref:hypothetical protein n=1 Tax=Bifidobacterium moraviense TaxID=2675323 RepID=UPI00145CD16E|nr:hypothetical protein [Bifidobacterium sp. DSM 109958]
MFRGGFSYARIRAEGGRIAEDSSAPNAEDEQSGSPPESIDWKARYEAEIERSKSWRGKAEANKSAADELAAPRGSSMSEDHPVTARQNDEIRNWPA